MFYSIEIFYREAEVLMKFSTSALILSLTSLVLMSFSSLVPLKEDGSSNDQCNLFTIPGNNGHRSEVAASQTVIT
jgi:hypothetical protein